MVLDGAAAARISASLTQTENTLEQYQNGAEFDDQISNVCIVIQKLATTLRVLRIALLQDLDPSAADDTLESLHSSNRVTAPLLEQLDFLRSSHNSHRSKRDSLFPPTFEDQDALILSFRKRMRINLYGSVSEIQDVTKALVRDINLVIQGIQRELLLSHIEKWPQNEVPFPIFKPPPLPASSQTDLCADCADIFQLRDSWPIGSSINPFQPSLSFHTSILTIFESACAGCHFCRVQLVRLLGKGAVTRRIQYAHVTWWKYWNGNYDGTDDDSSFSKDLRIRYLSRDLEIVHFDYFITTPLTELDQVRRIGTSTASRTSLAVVKKWLVDCTSNHEKCKEHSFKVFQRPTRLIYLGETENVDPRIVDHREIPSDKQYMTLSHRRCPKESTQLLTRNSRNYHRRIPEISLPRTYLDAMRVARELGVSYLWIDSLCIIQDSTKDWHRETAKISDIYAGGYCNIAAISCLDDTNTMHPKRNLEEVKGCIIKHDTNLVFSVRAHDEGYKAWNTSITESPLLERGWVFQELHAAPRTLFFAKDQLYWQCKTQKASEGLPHEPDITTRRYKPNFTPFEYASPQFYGPNGWAEIVYDFSRCQFTFPEKDKLVALSGITRKYGNEQNYLAGLWKLDIIFELTWRCLPSSKNTKIQPPKEYQAPSWSWVSLNQQVVYSSHVDNNMFIHQPIAELIDTNLTHVSENLFGQVSQGVLHLHAPIITLSYHRLSKSSYTVHYNTSPSFNLPTSPSSSTSRHISLDHPVPFRPAALDEDESPLANQTYFIPLYLTLERPTRRPKRVHGLIVEKVGGNKREFKRKGVMTLEGRWWVEDLTKEVKKYIGVADEDIFEGLVGEEEGGWVVFDIWVV